MPFEILNGDLTHLENKLPRGSQFLDFEEITTGLDTDEKLIKGELITLWPLQRHQKSHLLKGTIKQKDASGPHSQIHVFFMDDYADQCQVAQVQDSVAIYKASVEPCTSSDKTVHPCQLIVSPEGRSHVWLLKRHAKSPSKGSPVRKKSPAVKNDQPTPGAFLDIQMNPSPQKGAAADATANAMPGTSLLHKTASPRKEREYTYTEIRNLKTNTTVNVFGIVKWFRPAAKSRGTDYLMSISLVDPSVDRTEKLKCQLFIREAQFLPQVDCIGEIIRMHRLKIHEFRGELQGQSGPGFSCLVFDGKVGGSLEPRTGHTMYTLTQGDKDKVESLRLWASEHEEDDDIFSQTPGPALSNATHSLSSFRVGEYHNVVCQVIAMCVLEPGMSMLLKVWDGTKIKEPVVEEEITEEQIRTELHADLELSNQARGYIYDVKVFDDHFPQAARVKPGDFILLNNLHAAAYKDPSTKQVTTTIEFCLHRGTTYSRKLCILDQEMSREVHRLRLILDEIDASSNENDSLDDSVLRTLDMPPQQRTTPKATQRTPKPSTSAAAPNGSVSAATPGGSIVTPTSQRVLRPRSAKKRKSDEVERTALEGRQEKIMKEADSVEDRCLLVTSTVVVGHQHIPRTKLEDVIKADVPDKFRVRANVTEYQPHEGRDLIKVYCSNCHFLSTVPTSSSSNSSSCETNWWDGYDPCQIDHGVKRYRCPQCSKHNKHDGPVLEYTYVVQILLNDGTGWIPTQIWRKQATTLFHNIRPEEALKDPSTLEDLMTSLKELCTKKKNQNKKPLLECCVMSYSTEHGTCYQIFDTVIAVND